MGLVHLAVILGCATLIFGQSFPRKCSEIPTMENFDSSKFTGLWYEITAKMNIVGMAGECPTVLYSSLSNDALETKTRVCFLGKELTVTGILEPVNVSKGQFNASYPIISSEQRPFWVLATDYTNYSVIGACAENNLVAVVVYAKSPKLEGASKDTVSAIVKYMTNEDLDKVFHAIHENCCYEP